MAQTTTTVDATPTDVTLLADAAKAMENLMALAWRARAAGMEDLGAQCAVAVGRIGAVAKAEVQARRGALVHQG